MKKILVIAAAWFVLGSMFVGSASAAPHGYWPLFETDGDVALNVVEGGSDGTLINGVQFVTDAQRGQVLEFDGVDGYVETGTIPSLSAGDNFTWSFWATSYQTPNNNVILGNRYPDSGWVKFTTNAFEFRDIAPTFNATINYPDFATDEWIHHAAVKNGPLLTYYRNGLALGSSATLATMPEIPFYFGGDQTVENWAGRMDDVATWTNALPSESIAGLAKGVYDPLTVPTEPPPSTSLGTVFADDFSTIDPANWVLSTRGLENNAPSGYDAPEISSDQLVLSGTTENQYWYGNTLESVQSFDATQETLVSIDRILLEGSGTAWRSSLWILGDDDHYLHFSQNIGENGWQYNANDVGGQGTQLPTGSGNNIQMMDVLELDDYTELAEMAVRVAPTGAPGEVNMEMIVDGNIVAAHGFSNFPSTFQVAITGQARAGGDSVTAVFDNLTVQVPVTTVSCDFNGDEACTAADIDLLGKEIIAGTNAAAFDLNGDGFVDLADQDQWRADAATENGFAAAYLNGDANLDGIVDAADLNVVGLNWQKSVDPWSQGDFDATGFVDAGDLNLLALSWQDSIPLAAATAKTVPEPTSLALFVIAGLALVSCRYRYR